MLLLCLLDHQRASAVTQSLCCLWQYTTHFSAKNIHRNCEVGFCSLAWCGMLIVIQHALHCFHSVRVCKSLYHLEPPLQLGKAVVHSSNLHCSTVALSSAQCAIWDSQWCRANSAKQSCGFGSLGLTWLMLCISSAVHVSVLGKSSCLLEWLQNRHKSSYWTV